MYILLPDRRYITYDTTTYITVVGSALETSIKWRMGLLVYGYVISFFIAMIARQEKWLTAKRGPTWHLTELNYEVGDLVWMTGLLGGGVTTSNEDGPFFTSNNGYYCYLLAIDEFSRYMWIFYLQIAHHISKQ